MSRSGGNYTSFTTPPAAHPLTLGRSVGGSAGWTSGGLFLAPVYVPGAIPLTQLGLQVTGAGDAGSTFVPTIYSDTGHGEANALLFAGTAVPTDAVAVAKAACAFTLPAGWVWAGGLFLNCPVTKPTVYAITSQAGLSPNGEISIVAAAQGVQSLPFQGGLAAPPATFTGGALSVVAPALVATT